MVAFSRFGYMLDKMVHILAQNRINRLVIFAFIPQQRNDPADLFLVGFAGRSAASHSSKSAPISNSTSICWASWYFFRKPCARSVHDQPSRLQYNDKNLFSEVKHACQRSLLDEVHRQCNDHLFSPSCLYNILAPTWSCPSVKISASTVNDIAVNFFNIKPACVNFRCYMFNNNSLQALFSHW